MDNYYTIGQFSKLANVTLRTIRYYDKINLLKPSYIGSNGYRYYQNEDLLTLQKILSLKEFGFSLEEIYPLLQDSNKSSFEESISLQTDLVTKKINHLTNLRDALQSTEKILKQKDINWNRIIELIQLSNIDNQLVEQYVNSTNLTARIKLHELCSTNHLSWFDWIFEQYDITKMYRTLEVGCGNGKLWESNHYDMRNREIFLTDSSQGMVEEVRKKYGKNYNCSVARVEEIPFKDKYFDTVIANHVFFYLKDVNSGIKEISRVLNNYGILYCTTYGKNHMREIQELVTDFDERITLSEESLADKFGIENASKYLNKYFQDIEFRRYDDELIVDNASMLVDYVLSCHGNQNEMLNNRIKEFKKYIKNIIDTNGSIHITKDCGIYICKKQRNNRNNS